MTENSGNIGDMPQEHGDQIQQGEDAATNALGVEDSAGSGAEPGAEEIGGHGAEQGLAPGDTQTQPTTDASVQPEGGDYAAEGAESTSGGEFGSEPTETSGESGEFSAETTSGGEFGSEPTETSGEQQF